MNSKRGTHWLNNNHQAITKNWLNFHDRHHRSCRRCHPRWVFLIENYYFIHRLCKIIEALVATEQQQQQHDRFQFHVFRYCFRTEGSPSPTRPIRLCILAGARHVNQKRINRIRSIFRRRSARRECRQYPIHQRPRHRVHAMFTRDVTMQILPNAFPFDISPVDLSRLLPVSPLIPGNDVTVTVAQLFWCSCLSDPNRRTRFPATKSQPETYVQRR